MAPVAREGADLDGPAHAEEARARGYVSGASEQSTSMVSYVTRRAVAAMTAQPRARRVPRVSDRERKTLPNFLCGSRRSRAPSRPSAGRRRLWGTASPGSRIHPTNGAFAGPRTQLEACRSGCSLTLSKAWMTSPPLHWVEHPRGGPGDRQPGRAARDSISGRSVRAPLPAPPRGPRPPGASPRERWRMPGRGARACRARWPGGRRPAAPARPSRRAAGSA